MKMFDFEPFKNHIIAKIDDLRVIIDTGSPVSMGRAGTALPSLGNPPLGARIPGARVEEISELLGSRIDVLLGVDVIGLSPFLVDWDSLTITFGAEPSTTGSEIPLSDLMRCPSVDADVNGVRARLVVDTGAKATYLRPELTVGRPRVGSYEDFQPVFGPFNCGSFVSTVTIGDIALNLETGAIPPDGAQGLVACGFDGILGNDIFAHYREVLYDLPNRRLALSRPAVRKITRLNTVAVSADAVKSDDASASDKANALQVKFEKAQGAQEKMR